MAPARPRRDAIHRLFLRYKEADEEAVGVEGISQLCADLGVEPDDIVVLVLRCVQVAVGGRVRGRGWWVGGGGDPYWDHCVLPVVSASTLECLLRPRPWAGTMGALQELRGRAGTR